MSNNKFIQIIFIIFFLAFAQYSQAEKKDIELYFFYSSTCPACHQAEALLGTLKTKYPHLQIKKFEALKNNNQKIYSALSKIYQVSSNSVPGIFIEEKGFNDYSSATISKIEKIIIRCSNQECSSPTQKLLTNAPKEETPLSKPSLDIVYIIVGIFILGLVSIKIFITKQKKTIH